ncbi:hypothetical protein RvY_12452-2 [Ramazzottius varieornatus]|uniref:Uncharacterized protein n=1 Tax=Ramazzottius varieornatus TaxID=947166 RepID=A0A1D1VTA9_RAMVA|nr:hypothetical protein RvY_12452-2 [Ramazzottius varieornatus]
MKSNEVRPALINASWYNTLKSFDFAWKDYPIPPPRIRALRDQDPDEVVQRIRTQLKQKHSSFDTIWRKHDPQVSAHYKAESPLSSVAIPGNSATTNTGLSKGLRHHLTLLHV